MFKLERKHIIKVGGQEYLDDHGVTWITLWKGDKDRRNYFQFYDTYHGFNVYLFSNENKDEPGIQLVFIWNLLIFKILFFLLK